MTRRVTVGPDGLLLDGVAHPLLSGEVHSWRIARADWPRVLDAVAGLGFRTVSTYVPWCVYETARGAYDFSTGSRDLPAFLGMVAERGMTAVARIGPNCGAELETSGWPRRVLDDPRCQALRPDGRPYLLPTSVHQAFMPSYGSRQTLTEIAGWYDAVTAVLAPLQWPDGPLVAVHVDNEMGYHFQGHAFALDYHPDTVAQWHEWRSDATPPPRDGRDGDEELRLDWVRFREHHLRRSIGTLAGMLRDRGLDQVALVHNDYPRLTTPLDQGALERSGAVDIAANDVYATAAGGRFVRDVARRLAGSTRLPHLAEMGVGWITIPWLLPMTVTTSDIEHCVWRALAGGVRAANVFMLVERDRWFGSPVSRRGEPREPLADVYRRLTALFTELDWSTLRRDARVLLIENRDESRRTAARAVRGDLVPAFRQVLPIDPRVFDGTDPDGTVLAAWSRTLHEALDSAGIEWDGAGSHALPDLTAYDAVVLPCVTTADGAVIAELIKAAAAGTTVVVGPRWPDVYEQLRPVDVLPQDVQVVINPAAVPALLPAPRWCSPEPVLDLTSLHGGGREVLIAINAGPEPLSVEVSGPPTASLRGRWRDETVSDGPRRITLDGWGVQVYEVTR